MKSSKLFLGLMAAGLTMGFGMQSCVSDEPFAQGGGEGVLRMQLVVNSDVTRAQITDDDALRANCVVYISGPNGLLYQFKGSEDIPESIRLKSGNYVAEAWTGDSVTASFDHKFFRGYKPFNITQDNNTSIVLNCKIANVVVSVDHTTVLPDLMKDWKITVSNSRGNLVFDASNMEEAKGYFMMPDCDIARDENGKYIKEEGEEGWPCYTNLNYKIEGTTAEGKHFEKEGPICPDGKTDRLVQHAHEYRLKLKYDPTYEETGGSFVSIIVSDDQVLIEDEIGIYSRPAIQGKTFDIERQLVGNQGAFKEQLVKISAFKSIEELVLTSADYDVFGLQDSYGVDLMHANEAVKEALKQKGLKWDTQKDENRNLVTSYLTFTPEYLNGLAERNDEYVLEIYVKDGFGRDNRQSMRIAVGEGAVVEEDLVKIVPVDNSKAPMAILGRQATLQFTVSDEAVNPVVLYREASDSNAPWQSAALTATRGSHTATATLTGLTPGTNYVCKAASDNWEGTELYYFATEAPFAIPFGNMETWGIANGNNAIKFPGNDYATQFWDSGNHGSATLGTTLTQGSSVMHHGGELSAELKSQYVALGGIIGKFAAGNLFAGTFGKTVGTEGAQLTFGQPYNGTHPEALSVWVSYTPQKVTDAKSGNPGNLAKNDWDEGQIYVAFATEPYSVNTSTKETNGVPANTFFNPDDPRILGYGEKTWAKGESYGTPTSMAELRIPIEWRNSAKTKEAKYIIIVCSASKYGDYFTGGRNSVMYLDDFELVY